MDAAARLDFVAPLFVPGDRPQLFAKAAVSGADAIILDLEDAVAASAKPEARAALTTVFTDLPVIVRINACETPWHKQDLIAVLALPVAAVMIPKAALAGMIEVMQSIGGNCPVIPLVETALGLSEVRQIAAIPGVHRLAFGSVDYAADLGADHCRNALLAARLELVLASRLASLMAPLDGVTLSFDDLAEIESDARHACSLGFGGKLCIHPAQIAAVLAGFEPGAADIDRAQRILACAEGVTTLDGIMIDPPVKLRARAVLKRSRCSAIHE